MRAEIDVVVILVIEMIRIQIGCVLGSEECLNEIDEALVSLAQFL